ncbi:phage tail protein [Pasteurella skyensis]|uniref:Phage tail protein n=1 Tax=Phocoenobacter skyensis TaxID=97481 RepID=A0AAJ6P1H7_9PAST|nr:phage tail protein [Pasteurella skyensis]MDP8173689.1 phage tail protein [Pasteurella skyensis]MDP8178057.1 phage tail protein [Pasteurella skyensis]
MATLATQQLEHYIATQTQQKQTVVFDEIIFANIPQLTEQNLQHYLTIPDDNKIVHRQAISQTGVVNENAVVYSVTLGTEIGDFDFNFIGLINSTENLLAVAIGGETIKKIKNKNNQQGNSITRSILLEFSNAPQLTNITIPAQTWQIDFTVRLKGLDEKIRLTNRDLYGRQVFFENGFKVSRASGNTFNINIGAGYVEGVRAENKTLQQITVSRLPCSIYLDLVHHNTVTGEYLTEYKFLQRNKADWTDKAGYQHYIQKLADIDSSGNITDRRNIFNSESAFSNFIPNHKKSSSVTSDSEDTVATSEAVKIAYDKATGVENTAFLYKDKVVVSIAKMRKLEDGIYQVIASDFPERYGTLIVTSHYDVKNLNGENTSTINWKSYDFFNTGNKRYIGSSVNGREFSGFAEVFTENSTQVMRTDKDNAINGHIIFKSKSKSICGVYDPQKIAQIWSMGIDYKVSGDGSNFGNLYGLAYKCSGTEMAKGHQAVWCNDGTPLVALGRNLWVKNVADVQGKVRTPILELSNGCIFKGYSDDWAHLNKKLYLTNKDKDSIWTDGGVFAKKGFRWDGQSLDERYIKTDSFKIQYLTTENLNNIITPGHYGQTSYNNISDGLNYPEKQAGTLIVSPSAWENGVMQKYVVWQSGNTYFRCIRGDGYVYEWKKINTEVKILTGTAKSGTILPIPAGFTEDQCTFFVSHKGGSADGAVVRGFSCGVDGRRVGSSISVASYNTSTDYGVNYIVIGVK